MAGGEEAVHQARAERRGAAAPTALTARAGAPAALAIAAAFGSLVTLAIFWPGIILYDSVDQYGQVLSGAYEDWHPPVMARLWSLFAAWWPGGAPMFLIQTSLYWLGCGLLAAALARRGKPGAGWATLGLGAYFLTSCWLGAVLKDAQMVGAMLAATGLVAWHRLADRRTPPWAAAIVLLLLAYAGLVRANAVFGVVPLALLLFGIAARRPVWRRTALGVAATAAAILVSGPVNHGLLGADESAAEKSLMIYDLTGIAAHGASVDGFEPAAWSARHCYSPAEWDPAGEPGCPGSPLLEANGRRVGLAWAKAILRHPIAYAEHRIGHGNVTQRLLVSAAQGHAVGPVDPEPNAYGLGARPGLAARSLHQLAFGLAWLPSSWPCFWLALDIVLVWAAVAASPGPERDIALALSLSALAMGSSLLVVSVASDLRYHLWTMIGAALALPWLDASRALQRRHLVAAAALGLVVGMVGLFGRLFLPPIM